MATPRAVLVDVSEADRVTLEGWMRRRKIAQALAMRARIVLACAEPGTTNGAVFQACAWCGLVDICRARAALIETPVY